MIFNRKIICAFLLSVAISIASLLHISNLGSYLILFLFFLMVLNSPAFSLGWLVLSTILLEKIGISSGNYLQTKFFLILFSTSLLLMFFEYATNNFQRIYKKINLFLIILILIVLISIKIKYRDFDIFYNYLTNAHINKSSDNVNMFYYVMISRWSGIALVSAVIIRELSDLNDFFIGLASSIFALIFTLNFDILIGMVQICKGVGGEGVQNYFINRADYSYKAAISLLSLYLLISSKSKNIMLLICILFCSIIFLILTAGKGGLIAFSIAILICMIYIKQYKVLVLLPLSLIITYIVVLSSNICNPNIFLDQHYARMLTKGVEIRQKFYNQSVAQFSQSIPEQNSNSIVYKIYKPIVRYPGEDDKSYLDRINDGSNHPSLYNSGSGSHNIFVDIINQYGLKIGLLIILLLITPVIYFLYLLKKTEKYKLFFVFFLGLTIITFIYANLTAALHVAILVPLLFSLSLAGIYSLKDVK